MPHTVLVGRLFANEAWILDTAGCQYGFRKVLVPFEKYLADKSCQISNEPTTYNAIETKDLNYFSTLPILNGTRAQREDIKLKRQARLHFAVFVNTHVSKDILDGSAAEFKHKLDSFVHELKLHMLNTGNWELSDTVLVRLGWSQLSMENGDQCLGFTSPAPPLSNLSVTFTDWNVLLGCLRTNNKDKNGCHCYRRVCR